MNITGNTNAMAMVITSAAVMEVMNAAAMTDKAVGIKRAVTDKRAVFA